MDTLRRLGFAVIYQAMFDATLDLDNDPRQHSRARDDRAKWRADVAARANAREFLTTESSTLEFWCLVAGVDEQIVLQHALKITDWITHGQQLRLHEAVRGITGHFESPLDRVSYDFEQHQAALTAWMDDPTLAGPTQPDDLETYLKRKDGTTQSKES